MGAIAVTLFIAESLPEPAAFRMGLEVQLLDDLVCGQRLVHDLEPVLAAADLAEDFV
jgi:hypothetical protein